MRLPPGAYQLRQRFPERDAGADGDRLGHQVVGIKGVGVVPDVSQAVPVGKRLLPLPPLERVQHQPAVAWGR